MDWKSIGKRVFYLMNRETFKSVDWRKLTMIIKTIIVAFALSPTLVTAQSPWELFIHEPRISTSLLTGGEQIIYQKSFVERKGGRMKILSEEWLEYDSNGNLIKWESRSKKYGWQFEYVWEIDDKKALVSLLDKEKLEPEPYGTALFFDSLGRIGYVLPYKHAKDSITISYDSNNRMSTISYFHRANIHSPMYLSQVRQYFYQGENLVRQEEDSFNANQEMLSKNIYDIEYNSAGRRAKAKIQINHGTEFEYTNLNEYLVDDGQEVLLKVANAKGKLYWYYQEKTIEIEKEE